MDGERFRLVGIHAQGLKSMRRGRGGSAAAARAASASSARCRRVMAQRARAAATTMRTGLRARSGERNQPPLTYIMPPCGSRLAMQMQPASLYTNYHFRDHYTVGLNKEN